MKVFNYKDIESQEVGEEAKGVSLRWLIDKKTPAPNFYMRIFEIVPGGYTPLHRHPWEHEVFILEGKGRVHGGGGERAFGPYDVVYIPPKEEHQFKNIGDSTIKMLCLIPKKD